MLSLNSLLIVCQDIWYYSWRFSALHALINITWNCFLQSAMIGQDCENYEVKRETVHCYPRNVDRCCTSFVNKVIKVVSSLDYLHIWVLCCSTLQDVGYQGQHTWLMTSRSNDSQLHKKSYIVLHNDYHSCSCAVDHLHLPSVTRNW